MMLLLVLLMLCTCTTINAQYLIYKAYSAAGCTSGNLILSYGWANNAYIVDGTDSTKYICEIFLTYCCGNAQENFTVT